mgnify:CR=1 FL=1
MAGSAAGHDKVGGSNVGAKVLARCGRTGPRRTDGGQEGATGMAKGQKRSNKEPKKPKADKKKVLATAGTVAGTMAKPKAGAMAGGGKK